MRLFQFLLICSLGIYGNTVSAADIGLKISSDANWKNWGDYILGQDLKQGFEKNGYSVEPAYKGNFYPNGTKSTQTDIYMHGFIPFNPPKDNKKINVLYLYYPLELGQTEKFKNLEDVAEPSWYSLQTELWNFDLIAVASPSYIDKLAFLGIKTIFTPQFTNPDKFYYEYDESKNYDILFVGRPGYERKSVLWAIESGFKPAVYGEGWEDKIPSEMFRGAYIDNDLLHTYYASAKIVLNDTRDDMKAAGFISNRVFDVTASGGFLISDYMPEIEQLYGDSIPMFKTKDELASLLAYYLSHPEERKIKAHTAQKITLENFTNDIIAKNIMQATKDLHQENHGLDYSKTAIKIPWPQTDDVIGDQWLVSDLLEGFAENNIDVRPYYYPNNIGFITDDYYQKAGNLLYMQFKYNRAAPEDKYKRKIMYLYFPTFIPKREKFKNTEDLFQYNTQAYLNNELEYFDLIATPAKKTLQDLKSKGYHAVFVPQFTNPQKFKPEYTEDLKTDLLFVGSNWYERTSVMYALELGYTVDVYGLNWKGTIPDKMIKGNYIPNNVLNRYYSSAKIVLNDQADDLASMGLVINRLYDVSATGAFVISKYSPYIEEIFGDSIPMFQTKEDLKNLLDYYLSHPEERQKKAEKAREITLKNYTNKIISNQFQALFQTIGKDKL